MKRISYLIAVLFVAMPFLSNAQTDAGQQRLEKSDETRENVQIKRAEVKQNLEHRREEVKKKMENRREELKEKIENKHETAKQRIKEHREQLKEKLTIIKDERKHKAVERIQDNLTALSERMVKHFTAVADKLDSALERIISRTDKAEQAGRDVALARTAIQKAETAIAGARTAIGNQAGKVYSVEIRTEDSLKADVGGSRKALHADLTALKRVVQAAHQAVREAAGALARVPRIDAVDSELENSATNQ